jgi:hypothetical protein
MERTLTRQEAHPSQQGGERERRIGKRAGGGKKGF